MKLSVVKRYRCRNTQYEAGTEIEVTEEEALHLFADAPECFAELGEKKTEEKDFEKPPVDKVIHRYQTRTK